MQASSTQRTRHFEPTSTPSPSAAFGTCARWPSFPVETDGDADRQVWFPMVDVVATNDAYLDQFMVELADSESVDVDMFSDVFSDDHFTESQCGTVDLEQVHQDFDFAREDDAQNSGASYLTHSLKGAVRLPIGSDGLRVETWGTSATPELDQLTFDFDLDAHIKDEPFERTEVHHEQDFDGKENLRNAMTDLDLLARELDSKDDTEQESQQYVEVFHDLDALLGLGTASGMNPQLDDTSESRAVKVANAQAPSTGQATHIHHHYHQHFHNYAQPQETSAVTSLALELIRLQTQQRADIYERRKLLPPNYGQRHRSPRAGIQTSGAFPDRVIATPAQSVLRARAPLPRAKNGQSYQNPDGLIAVVDQVLRGPPSNALGVIDAALRQLEAQLDRMGLGDKAKQQLRELQQKMECGGRREAAKAIEEPDRECKSDAPRKLPRHNGEGEDVHSYAEFGSYGTFDCSDELIVRDM
ncbi:hypothetical protein HDU88_000054 [Geranomyces variabilis]|nr:hypothetical protein HDU88_000054 [Geranomyces variabilis]